MAKEINLTRNEYQTYWRNGERGMIDVEIYHGPRSETNLPVVEWSYPKVVGSSILGNASFWLDQVMLEIKSQNSK